MPSNESLPDLLRAAAAGDVARPFLTFDDDATGERVELSVVTYANWVAKTANLLVDALAVEPGARVALLLPLHWQGAVWLSACWAAGVVAAPVDEVAAAAGADVLVAAPDQLADAAAAGAADTVGVSLRPLGGRLEQPPAGVLDYAAEVPGYGDVFTPVEPVDSAAVAFELAGQSWTGGELAAAARERGSGDRVLSALPYSSLDGVLVGLLAPMVSGGSVVLCRRLDTDMLDSRVRTENVTAVAGTAPPPGSGLPTLSVPS